ncbi:MAG: hypothetical protein ABF752_12620 [Acetobacter fabarum]|uniref:hypothetical protein n=1 Tax=Acetobacter fabarum TaxID=483199 RepID=UPI0039E901CA
MATIPAQPFTRDQYPRPARILITLEAYALVAAFWTAAGLARRRPAAATRHLVSRVTIRPFVMAAPARYGSIHTGPA